MTKKDERLVKRHLAAILRDPALSIQDKVDRVIFYRDPNRVIVGKDELRALEAIHAIESPPTNAEFFFYLFTSPQNCDALVGDLCERYKLIRKKFGARRANFWYWVQVITSVGPIVWAATKKLLKAVSGVAALVEMWRRIRS